MRETLGELNPKQNLSSDTLFHFTASLEVLVKILRKGFQVRYIYEKLPQIRLAYFVETVCFCDIPLGAIKNHLNWYGNYGIGINRKKAKEKGFSPVIYIHQKSPHIVVSGTDKNIKDLSNSPTTKYLKQIRGKQLFYNKEKDNKPYWRWKTFYEEREWRYFPETIQAINVEKYKKETDLDSRRNKLNATNSLSSLKIDNDWIEYIIVDKKIEIPKIISIIKKLFKSNSLAEILISKILTSEQIAKDF